jgi:hypothetical protein
MVIGDEMWFSGLDSAGNYTIGYATGQVPEPGTIINLVGLAVVGCALGLRSWLKKK